MVMIPQDQRPKDWAYRVAFDQKDLPSLQEMMRHIRETHDVDMIERFNNNCDQFLKGDNPIFEGNIQPINISKTEDLMTNPGIQQCINIILGTSAVRWSHIQVSRHNSAVPPDVNDLTLNVLSGGPYVLPLATYGWSEAKGMKLFFGAIGPQDANTPLGSSTINEMGVFNTATGNGATMLNHETFFDNPLTRNITQDLTVFASVFLFSCVIEFCPVT